MADWKEIYREQGTVQANPSKQIVKLVPLLKREGIEKVLDLGCGTGRHVKYLALAGFYVVGTDYSNDAIAEAKRLVAGLSNIELIQSEMSHIPYEDSFFDAVICSHVVQHGLRSDRDKSFYEMWRVLRPNGLLFLRTTSRKHRVYGKGKEIEPDTFINISELPDGDTPHHYFSDEELRKCLSGFDIVYLEHHSFPPEPNDFWKHGLEEWVLLGKKR
ncbi:MAG: class I SAM-dependent methyltransferase [Nanoarchaeota archaeon]|nr:class I SAM-dependent methyltransferase [Nanoarchaeota archaeon]MBU1321460.1 class I SAM-dependent methyltransferase [Nanoarchaeota archaeon]MBU1596916.1 class I SAM-dependent methyltransferase [Nanoarchaeota archaeon]MBU2441547.1 class I SAM-dependent methyltransferase [Nanoarchaeota archaeon]